MSKDYFITETKLTAYNINDFAAGIVEIIQNGKHIDPDSAVRVGINFQVNITEEPNENQEQPEVSGEKEEDTSESTETSESSSSEGVKPLSEVTDEEIDALVNEGFDELKEFANQYGVTGRSKSGIAKELKEKRDEDHI